MPDSQCCSFPVRIEFLYLHSLKGEGYICGEVENYVLIKARTALLTFPCGIFHVYLSAFVKWINPGFSVCLWEFCQMRYRWVEFGIWIYHHQDFLWGSSGRTSDFFLKEGKTRLCALLKLTKFCAYGLNPLVTLLPLAELALRFEGVAKSVTDESQVQKHNSVNTQKQPGFCATEETK